MEGNGDTGAPQPSGDGARRRDGRRDHECVALPARRQHDAEGITTGWNTHHGPAGRHRRVAQWIEADGNRRRGAHLR
jgi:hypothetical protein